MCRVIGVSRAHYYRYKAHKPSKRSLEDKDLKQRIFSIFVEFKQRYGVMKIHYELSKELQPLQRHWSPRRVSRLMKEMDIHSITIKKWKATSSYKQAIQQRPNLLKQDFSTTGLNQKWTTDITYIQTKRDGWCYLSTITDLHSRQIIGYSFSKKMDTKLIMKTLESAVQNRTITEDLIIHSDLGTQYTSDEYNKRLNELHIRHSYSRKGCPYDNAQWNLSMLHSKRNAFTQFQFLKIMKRQLQSSLNMFIPSIIGKEFIVHSATRPPCRLKSQRLRTKWPHDLMLSMVQISY